MTKAISKTNNLFQDYVTYINMALLLGCMFLTLVYIFNMYALVSKTVSLQKMEKDTAKLENQVRTLDVEYISLSNKITPELAKHYGLSNGNVSAFIQRTNALGSLYVAKEL